MTILDISFFNFWNSTRSISSEALNPLKTISDDSMTSQRSSFNPEKKSKSSIFLILTMSGPYGLYMYALETCVCSGDMVYAVWTWYMLSGQGICCLDRVYAVWTRYMLFGHVFLWDKNIWIWKMSSCWRRIYGDGMCLLVGLELFVFVYLFFFIFLYFFLFFI